MSLDFKEQDSMYSKPLCNIFSRYSNALAVKRLLTLSLLSLPIGCLASR